MKRLLSVVAFSLLAACHTSETQYAGISGTGATVSGYVVASEVFIGRYPFGERDNAPQMQQTFAAANSLGSSIIKGEVAYVSQAQGLLRLSGENADVVLTKETLLVGPEGRVLSPNEFFGLLEQGATVFIEANQR